MTKFNLGSIELGQDSPLYFIADIAANHDGDLSRAYKLIELAKESGAHAAKFQNFKASKIVSKNGFENLGGKLSHQSNWKKSVYQTYEEASISYDWTSKLKEKCDEFQIEYFTSPYDFKSVDHADPYVNVFKIGSGDLTWHEIIDYIAKKGKPVMIATGASTLQEVGSAMQILMDNDCDIVLMQCNTNYTAEKNNFNYINLNVLKQYKKLFPRAILGLSDHTHGHSTVLGSIPLGARVFEKHFTDDNSRQGPDHKFAMNPDSWSKMVEFSNEVYMALGDGEKKIEKNEEQTSLVQRRGLWFTRDLNKGHQLLKEDIIPLRPYKNDGYLPYQINEVLGKKLKNSVKGDSCLHKGDLFDD